MRLAKYAQQVKGRGYCLVAHVGDECWMGTGAGIYRASGMPWIEGRRQVGMVLDLPEKAWEKIHLQEETCESIRNVMGLNLSAYMDGEESLEKFPVMAAPDGRWAACFQGKKSGELIFYNPQLLAPLDDVMESDYVTYTARKDQDGKRYIVVHDGFEVLAAIMPIKIITEEYLANLQEFQALCMSQFLREKDRAAALEEEHEEEPEQIGIDLAEV